MGRLGWELDVVDAPRTHLHQAKGGGTFVAFVCGIKTTGFPPGCPEDEAARGRALFMISRLHVYCGEVGNG